jgi:hypothetical protein
VEVEADAASAMMTERRATKSSTSLAGASWSSCDRREGVADASRRRVQCAPGRRISDDALAASEARARDASLS